MTHWPASHSFDFVLALVALGERGPDLEVERHGLACARLAGDGHAPVVAPRRHDVLLRRPACVPDERKLLQLVRMGLADVRRVVDDERVPVDEPHGVGLDGVSDLFVKSLGLQVAAQSVLDIAVLVLRSDGTGDVRDDRVACRLYPVDHVADELVLRLRKTVKHFHHKIVELRSRFPRDCAIIHRAVLSFGWLSNRVLYSVRRRNGQRFRIRSHQAFQAGGRRESCE